MGHENGGFGTMKITDPENGDWVIWEGFKSGDKRQVDLRG